MNEVTVTLPVWLPIVNLALGLVALAALVYLTFRAWRRGELRGAQTITITIFVWASVLIIVGGSLSQLGLLSIEVWAIIGTGGRIILAVGLLTVATLPADDTSVTLPPSPNTTRLARMETTVEHTAEQVQDIHQATVKDES